MKEESYMSYLLSLKENYTLFVVKLLHFISDLMKQNSQIQAYIKAHENVVPFFHIY